MQEDTATARIDKVLLAAPRGRPLAVRRGVRVEDRGRRDGVVLVAGDGLSASAPYADLAEHFGFAPDQLAARVLAHVREASEQG